MNRLLLSLTTAVALITTGCQDSGSPGDYVPFADTAPKTASTTPDTTGALDTTGTPDPTPDTTGPGSAMPPADSVATDSTAAAGTPQTTVTPTPDASATAAAPDATGNPATSPAPPLVTSPQSGLSGPADQPTIENSASDQPRTIQLLIPNKRFRKERPSNALRVSYDDIDLLKVLNMEPVPADAVSHFPDWLKQLDGQTVRIRGYMYPTFEATGLTAFTLARDNGICCFVRQPKIYDIISVSLAPGEVSDYIANRPFDVEGIFRIDPGADQTDLSRLYKIEQARVLN